MRTEIVLPVFNLRVELHTGGGTITSDLTADVDRTAPGDEHAAAMDAVEALVLAHAVAGVDIATPEYVTGLQHAVDAIADQFA